MNDPEGKEFPWKPKPLLDVLPGNFIDNKKNTFTMDDLKDKYLGIYFSAHWCPPCKNFTPKLVAGYEKWKADGKNFEVIFASRDRTEDSFNKYFESMPWLALPFEDSRVGELAKIFEVSGIPMLIILDPCRNIITSEGRGAVMKDPEGKAFPWYPPPCYELDSFSSGIINEEPCLILFADIEEDDDVQKAMNLMKPVAEKIIQAEKDKCKEAVCKFMVAGDDDMVESLQQFLGIADESLPLLILLDIPEQRVSLCEEKEINTEVIQGYYDKFAGDKLTWKALGQ